MINPAWTVRVEGLYADLGNRTVAPLAGSTCADECRPVNFKNELLMVRLGLNYKFGHHSARPW